LPQFSANISTLFCELPFLDRMAAARKAGFRAVEMQFPYEIPLEQWMEKRRRNKMRIILINVPAGDLLSGGPGLAAMPERKAEFRDAVQECARYAKSLSVNVVNVLAGAPPADLDRARCMACFVDNLHHAAEVMADIGVGVVMEPINTRARAASLISTTAEGLQAIDWASHANLSLQYDLFHAQIMEGDLMQTLEENIARIGHIQFADVPARSEPGTGEINFTNIFEAIDRMGYKGWLGAEYIPSTTTAESLSWFQPFRRSQLV
jgi:hydroxypyruvate isomerase